jgi:glycosyltransferase involved in cell wall biosynthesis
MLVGVEKKKVVFCTPTMTRPFKQFLEALENEVPEIEAAGFDHEMVFEVGCPYISAARATLLRKALDAKADIIVFLDHDLSWRKGDLVKLISTEEPVVAGMYRYKKDEEDYMGALDIQGDLIPVRRDGCVPGFRVPAGFLKITKEAVNWFMAQYPELIYGVRYNPTVDLFNHGAHKGIWYGEDMMFSKRWIDACGKLWVLADLSLTHWGNDGTPYYGNLSEFLTREGGFQSLKDSQDQRDADLLKRLSAA